MNDLALEEDGGGGALSGDANNNNNNDSANGMDDGHSFAESNLEHDLERELTRRSIRRTAKRCAVVAALCLGLVALISRGRRGGLGKAKQQGQGPAMENDDDEMMQMMVDDTMIDEDTMFEIGASDDAFPILVHDDDDNLKEEVLVEDIQEQIEDLAALFNAAQALPPYDICPPPMKRDRPATQQDDAVFHIGEFRIVPEDDLNNNDNDDIYASWQYSLSDMDVSDDASIIAIGMGDYAADTGYAVGMVRIFAYSCDDHEWKRLGQDLLGNHEYEMFGHRVSSNKDGRVLAISAPQESYDGGMGFVEVYSLDEKSGRWELLGERIDELDKAENEYYMLGHAVDISDRGETLAVLGIIDDEYDNPSYVTRVFDYDYRKKEWLRKGKDVIIANVTFGRDYSYDYSPQVSLSEKGDKLIVTDPQMGVVKCTYGGYGGVVH